MASLVRGEKMKKIFLISLLIMALVATGVNASVGAFVEFTDESRSKTILEGDSVGFKISPGSDEGSFDIDHVILEGEGKTHHYIGPTNVKISSNNHEQSFTINKEDYEKPGNYKIMIAVKAPSGASATDEISLSVIPNTPPKIVVKANGNEVSSIDVEDNEEVIFDLSGSSDEDGDVLTYDVKYTPKNGQTKTKAKAIGETFSLQAPSSIISYTLEFIVKDTRGGSTSKTILMNIGQPTSNQVPQVEGIPNQNGAGGNYQVVASDDDPLTYSLKNAPNGMNIDSSGKISWNNVIVGTYTITVVVKDGKNDPVEKTFTLTVNESTQEPVQKSNQIPQIATIKDFEGILGDNFEYQVSAIDPDGDTIGYTLSHEAGDDGNLGLSINSGGKIIGKLDKAGTFKHRIQVGDNKGNSFSNIFTITVKEKIKLPEPTPLPKSKRATGPVVGDANHDGEVNAVDFIKFAAAFGGSEAKFDFDKDGKVGFNDFLIFASNFGRKYGEIKFLNLNKEKVDTIEVEEGEDIVIGAYVIDIEDDGKKSMESSFGWESNLGSLERKNYVVKASDGSYLQNVMKAVTNRDTIQHPAKEREFTLKVWKEFESGRIEKTLKIIVKDVNRAPEVLEVKGSSSVDEDKVATFTVIGFDADGDSLTYEVNDKRLKNEGKGVFTWKPGFEDGTKNYEFAFTVKDSLGKESAKMVKDLKVLNVNRLPNLKFLDNKGKEIAENDEGNFEIRGSEGSNINLIADGNTIEFKVESTGTDPDTDSNDILTIDLLEIRNPEGTNLKTKEGELMLPKGLEYNDGKVTWNVRKNQGTFGIEDDLSNLEKPYTFKFKLTDGKDSEEKTIGIFVQDTIHPFYPSLFEQESAPEAILSLTSFGQKDNGKWEVHISAENSDDKQDYKDELIYSYDFDNDGIYDKLEGKLKLNNVEGDYRYKNLLKSTVVHAYAKPHREEVRIVQSVKPQKIVRSFVTIGVRIEDLDGMSTYIIREIEISKRGGDAPILPRPGEQGGPTTPTPPPSGEDDGEDEQQLGDPKDKVPRLKTPILDQTITEGNNFQVINLKNHFVDDDGETLTFSASQQGSALQLQLASDGIVTILPGSLIGSESITFSASDDDGSVSDTAVFTVNKATTPPGPGPSNQAPRLVSPILDQTINEGNNFQVINLKNHFVDDDGDVLTFSASQQGSLLGVQLAADGVVTILPGSLVGGSESINFSATDNKGGSASDIVVFTVNAAPTVPVNQAPQVSNIPGEAIINGQGFKPINLNNLVSDDSTPDSQISWSVSGNSQINVNILNGVATLGYASNFIGSETLTFTATDAQGASTSNGNAAVFTVNPIPNKAPIVSDIPGQTILQGETFSTVNLNSFVTDDKTSSSSISWSVSGNSQLSINIANGVATITAPVGFLSKETLTFTATDADGASASDSGDWEIIVNANPILDITRNGASVSAVNVNEGETLTLILDGSDSNGDNLLYDVVNSPVGATLSGNVFTWIPSNTQGGKDYVLTFRVFDLNSGGNQRGGSGSKTVTVSVQDVLEPIAGTKVSTKINVHSLEVGSIIVNGWETVRKGELFDIDVFAKNRGNVKAKDVKVTLEIPQLDFYTRSDEFNIKKRREERRSFAAEVPKSFKDNYLFVIVTVSNDRDEDREVMGFLVE
jgi:hypothetical protein